MSADDSILETEVTLKVPRGVFGQVRFFTPGQTEQTVPIFGELGKGLIRSSRLSPALGFLDTKFRSSEYSWVGKLVSPAEMIKFSFILSEEPTKVTVDGEHGCFFLHRDESVILSVPSAVENEVPRNYGAHNVCLYAAPGLILPILEEIGEKIPLPLRSVLEGRGDPYCHRAPTTPGMKVILDQVLHCPFEGRLGRLYLESKALEIISLRLWQLINPEAISGKRVPLSPADKDNIRLAESILLKNLRNPPSLDELARMAAVNVTKLKFGFREIFKTTVFGYLRAR